MPLPLISGTFVFGSSLWAQTELELHTLWLKKICRGIQSSKAPFPRKKKKALKSLIFCAFEDFLEILLPALFCLILNLRETGNRRGWEENLQLLAPFDVGIALYAPYSAKPLVCHKCSFFMRCLWGQPRPVPNPPCTCSNISSFDEWLSEEHSDHIELELPPPPCQSFSAVLSSNALPLFVPCEWMCFEAYKGPQHWLNHLFRIHHLQGLVAMLTSFSDAPGAPGSAVSTLAVRATEVGRSSPPTPATGPSCLNTSFHPPHRCSHSLFPEAPQACDYSLMLALGKKEGVSWVCALRLEAANTKRLATQMWDYRTETCGCMSGEHTPEKKKNTHQTEGEL